MAWIRTVPLKDTNGELLDLLLKQRAMYPRSTKNRQPARPQRKSLLSNHADFLRRATLDEELVAAIREDYRTAPYGCWEGDARIRRKVTKGAVKITPKHHERLRS